MTETTSLAAKVLLLEHDPGQYQALLDFCDRMGLMALPRKMPSMAGFGLEVTGYLEGKKP